ncbi:MAG: hypothetical protein IPH34_11200 [Chitinophagaceae bacterium]|nr:hypothetical protein [Chitinophagaceae bacterium]MBK8310326.1 hypothetical protein [Chitinophagaceae bacterium]MBK8606861.1 hypothetical protein [Chitinophagaceae bacterium]MBP6476772.1 hypothetical protein [Chitinophagaceae bacterium]MBP7108632.1 hypothetical protein [Chitinophagaceae bacterium]
MDTNQLLVSLREEISALRKQLPATLPSTVTQKWISRADVMAFLDYKNTQMCSLEQTGDLVMTQIGRRKFILRESFEKLLERSIIN